MKKALFAIVFCAFLPSMAMADHHHSSIGLSFGIGGGYYRGYDYCPPPVSYYSYSYYPAYSYSTYAYPPPVYVESAPVYVAPPRVYVEPAPRFYYESRYRDYGGRYYESERPYRRY